MRRIALPFLMPQVHFNESVRDTLGEMTRLLEDANAAHQEQERRIADLTAQVERLLAGETDDRARRANPAGRATVKIALDLAALDRSPACRTVFAPLAARLTGRHDDMEFVPVAGDAGNLDFSASTRQLLHHAALLATGVSTVLTFATDAALFLSDYLPWVAAPNLRVAVALPADAAIPPPAATRAVCWVPLSADLSEGETARAISAALRQDEAERGVPIWDFAYRQPKPPRETMVSAPVDGLPHRRAALITPFPPLQSGVADYSVEIMEPLTRFYDLDLYTIDGYKPRLPPGYVALGHTALERALRAGQTTRPYDLLIYQFGNNAAYHADMYALLRRYAGIVVLHDYVLADLVMGVHFNRPELGVILPDEIAHHTQDPKRGQRLFRQLESGEIVASDFAAQGVSLTRRVFTRSLGIIVHNQWSYEMAMKHHAQDNPLITLIPPVMPPVPLDDTPETIAKLRRKYGVPVDAFVIAPCGIVTKTKRPLEILDAFRALLPDRPDAYLVFVGSVSNQDLDPNVDFASEIARRGLTDRITISGYVDIPTFNEYLRLSDVCVTLRYPSQGETSGALLRMLVHAKASIVTDIGSFANFPDDTVHKLPIPEGMRRDDEVAMILAAFRRMATDDAYRRDLGARGRGLHPHRALARAMRPPVRRIRRDCSAPSRDPHQTRRRRCRPSPRSSGLA